MTLKKIFFLAITFLISFPNFSQERMNKLINEKSLYLRQHSSNPVDWMPWGDDALSLAKGQKKLMIISVGYSSCHWCHVMEEETFSNEEAAKIMNDKFINVKVDREERPDVDELYMKSLVLMIDDLTLKNISYGGINDHIEGGLHRYTVDSIWHVPHFEKMLYDNAQMLSVYSKAYKSTKKQLYKREIDNIFSFIENNLSGNDGLLYSSISAVTEIGDEKIEGDSGYL